MFFARMHRCDAVLKRAQDLIAEYEKRNDWLETENLKLIGLAYPLSSSIKTEGIPMITSDVEQRVIALADAAGRANSTGLHGLADKLTKQAEDILSPRKGPSFVEWAQERNYNLERVHGSDQQFASKHTQELFECWIAARGERVAKPPAN